MPRGTLTDLNGDGRVDLLISYEGGTRSYINIGQGFKRDDSFISGIPYTLFSNGVQQGTITDLNGDGLADLLVTVSGVNYGYLNKGGIPDRLSRVTSGQGVKANITYKPINDKTVYTGADPQPNEFGVFSKLSQVRAPIYVVSDLYVDNGINNGQNHVSYKYENARSDNQGRGFLGFAAITETEDATATVTKKIFYQSYPYTGNVGWIRTTVNGINVSLASNTVKTLVFPGTRRFPYVERAEETTWDYTTQAYVTSKTTDNENYDNYGNVRKITVNVYDAAGGVFTTVTNNLYSQDNPSAWILGRLTDAAVTTTRPGENGALLTGIRKSAFTYDPVTGQLVNEIIEPDYQGVVATDPNYSVWQKTTHGYDQYGNRTTATVIGNGIDARTTAVTYSYDGYFQKTLTNAMGAPQTETYVYDTRFGAPTSLIGPNGLATKWDYDEHGKKTKEPRHDSNTTTYVLTSCNQGTGTQVCGQNEKFYSTTQSSGGAPVIQFYDAFAREVRSKRSLLGNNVAEKAVSYDSLGRVTSVTNEYSPWDLSSNPALLTCSYYDALGRKRAESWPSKNGCNLNVVELINETTYEGLKTTATLHNKVNGQIKDQVKQEWRNGLGERIKIKDDLAEISYRYNALGNLTKTVVTPTNDYNTSGSLVAAANTTVVTTTMGYDLRGRKITMNDPDTGRWDYRYNAVGDLIWQKDAEGKEISMVYDKIGRLFQKTEPEDGTTVWVYDSAPMGVGKLDYVYNATTQYQKNITYDSTTGRPVKEITSILSLNTNDSRFSYKTDITYNSYGQLATIAYPETANPAGGATPARLVVRNEYDTLTGQLKKVRNNATTEVYWELNTTNTAGQITTFTLGDGLTTYNTYVPETGSLSMITTTGNMQNLVYGYDRLGNLLSRRDNIRNMTEAFGYDVLNRLTSSTITVGTTTPTTANYQYDSLGNIKAKPGFGDNYIYGEAVVSGPNNTLINAGPHAVTTVKQGGVTQASYRYNRNGAMVSGGGRYFTYKASGQVASVSKGGVYSTFKYSPDQIRMVQTTNQGTTVYLNPDKNGNRLYDKEIVNGVTTHVHYISGATGVIAEYRVKDTGTAVTAETQYLHKDHLGSVDLITKKGTNGVAVEVQRMSFSPFGERRSAAKWSDQFVMPAAGMVTRQGYTGHEQMDELGIVQMNGRLYDAKIGRVLSADPYIQAPANSQSFNRYSYVMNGPLSATDPSGYRWKALDYFINPFLPQHVWAVQNVNGYAQVSVIAAGAFLGSGAASAVTALNTVILGGTPADGLRAGLFAYASAGIASGIGGMGMNPFGAAMAHGVTQGALARAQGGTFRSGFASGFMSSIAPIPEGYGGDGPTGLLVRTSMAATVGGTASVIGGGKFANGAVTGAFVHLFNDEAHKTNPAKRVADDALQDGHLSLGEANDIWRANNDPNFEITIDANKLTVLQTGEFGSSGTATGRIPYTDISDWVVHGSVKLSRSSLGNISILSGSYDFQPHGSYLSRPVRNFETYGGFYVGSKAGTSVGTDYLINYSGHPNVIR